MEEEKETTQDSCGEGSGSSPPGEEEALRREIEALKQALEEKAQEAEANYDRFLRARADLENMRRLLREEMERVRRFCNQRLLAEVLDITDNLERALEAFEGSDHSSVRQGVEIIYRQMRSLLEREGVRPIPAEPGQPFDPQIHEAVEGIISGDYPEGTIVAVRQPGYLLHERVLRPARVCVALAPPKEEEGEGEEGANP